MQYIVHNAQGEIVRHGVCPAGDFAKQANQDGEAVVEGTVTNETNIVDGVAVRIEPDPPTQSQIDDKNAKEAEIDHAYDIQVSLADMLLDFDNRLRDLEKKPAIDKSAFVAELRGKNQKRIQSHEIMLDKSSVSA